MIIVLPNHKKIAQNFGKAFPGKNRRWSEFHREELVWNLGYVVLITIQVQSQEQGFVRDYSMESGMNSVYNMDFAFKFSN